MTEFFTADLHFGHARLLELVKVRGETFASVEEMDETLIKNWNSAVSADDHVWVLGDFDIGGKEQNLAIVQRLNGHKTLIAGNHDRCAGLSRDAWKHTRRYVEAGFEGLHDHGITTLPDPGRSNIRVMLSHYPYEGDSHRADRYEQVRLRDLGVPLLHGHVHDAFRSGYSTSGTPMINVGVDVWDYYPIPAETASKTLREMIMGLTSWRGRDDHIG